MVSYPTNINSKFFAYNSKPKDNAILDEKMSGRTIGILANTKNTMQISCSIAYRIPDELNIFWHWYQEVLGGLTGVFTCPALGTKMYRFISTPEPSDTNQTLRVLSFNLEEV